MPDIRPDNIKHALPVLPDIRPNHSRHLVMEVEDGVEPGRHVEVVLATVLAQVLRGDAILLKLSDANIFNVYFKMRHHNLTWIGNMYKAKGMKYCVFWRTVFSFLCGH